jgi:hypothetical protein
MYDIIGDTHGHANELQHLLEKLGYTRSRGYYTHPTRQVIFVGDFIDRGPKIRELLGMVRPMVENGAALAVMGNHEFNALAYHTEDKTSPGEYLRRHSAKNVKQHAKTVEQLSASELKSNLNWFRTLPIWLDLAGLRVVHACWDQRHIDMIQAGLELHGGMTDSFLHAALNESDVDGWFPSVDAILKGKEAKLPEGHSFFDKDGHERTSARTRWYLSPENQNYRTYLLESHGIRCEEPLHAAVVEAAEPYPVAAKPVFVGHYWLSEKQPALLAHNVACLDYSVAKGGFLCAYRWDGEQCLSNDKFVWVPSQESIR